MHYPVEPHRRLRCMLGEEPAVDVVPDSPLDVRDIRWRNGRVLRYQELHTALVVEQAHADPFGPSGNDLVERPVISGVWVRDRLEFERPPLAGILVV